MLQSARSTFFRLFLRDSFWCRRAGLAWSHRWQHPHNLDLHISPRLRQETDLSFKIFTISNTADPYLQKIRAVGFPAYEKAHRKALATKFAAKAFPRLPTDVAGHVVAFAFHVGYY